ncbi:MAG: hypothetical protein ACOYOK_14935, partial [Pseudobdellovibrionaceae bacterium]
MAHAISAVNLSLARQMKSFTMKFAIGYFIVTGILSALLFYFYHFYQVRLAMAYTTASSYSLTIRDNRQAIASLSPAIQNGFASVLVMDANQNILVTVPALTTTNSFSSIRISKSMTAGQGELIYLDFYYSIIKPTLFVLAIFIFVFLCFIFLFKQAKIQLEE